MSAVLLAVFTNYAPADRARTDLVRDGFPTDRVDLTATCDPGRAGLEPGGSLRAKVAEYFRTLLSREPHHSEPLADAIDRGAATVIVHPRGVIEIGRAVDILQRDGAIDIMRHDLENQTFEHAAARSERAWVRNFWVELPQQPPDESHCIYCRLFERRSFGA